MLNEDDLGPNNAIMRVIEPETDITLPGVLARGQTMEELERQVRRAYRRMGLQRFAKVLAWCWFVTLLVALGLITLDKFYPLGVPSWAWAAGALGLGLAMAAAWIAVTRRASLGAAIEIDHRFGLKERVSSTLAMAPEDRHSEAGKALIDDAIRRVRRVDVATKFAVAPDRTLLLPLLPGLLAVLVACFVAQAKTEDPKSLDPKTPVVNKQVKKSTEALRQTLADRREQAKKMGLKEAERLFDKLHEAAREMAEGKIQRKDALVKLNDLARELKKRRDQAGGIDQIKKQLDQLKDVRQGPADKFAKAVRRGDLEKAVEELDKMRQELADGKLSDEQKEQLAKQLDKMQQKLDQIAQEHQQAQQELQQKIDGLREAGQLAEADKLQQQLDQLRQQAPAMQQLAQMAGQLQQCAESLRNGEPGEAADALGQLQNDLQQQLAEMELMQEAMDQLAQARQQMNCRQCGGFG